MLTPDIKLKMIHLLSYLLIFKIFDDAYVAINDIDTGSRDILSLILPGFLNAKYIPTDKDATNMMTKIT
jgi:hypothetical protein